MRISAVTCRGPRDLRARMRAATRLWLVRRAPQVVRVPRRAQDARADRCGGCSIHDWSKLTPCGDMLPFDRALKSLLRSSWTGAPRLRPPRFSLRDYLDRKVCTMFIAAHERDWWHWQEERVSRCKHCRSSMPDPFTETA
jgi:hypothetical protein